MEDNGFRNIDYANKAIAQPRPERIDDIDTSGSIYDNIITASDNNILDLTTFNSFTTISQSRDEIYNMLDIMCEDPIISIALDIYTADCCETNDKGQIVWAESDDENVLGMVQHLIDQLSIDKNAYNWVHSLIKYGDLYLRLYRESEFEDPLLALRKDGDEDSRRLNEGLTEEVEESSEAESLVENVIVKAFKKDDHYAEYMDKHKNPAEVFELQKFGKTVAYLRSHIDTRAMSNDDLLKNYSNLYTNYSFNKTDVDIYSPLEFVHACIEDNSSRTTEEVTITTDEYETPLTYNVKRGQSILYNTFRTWRELSLLENSVLLNRITKSSIVRTVSVEVGDMEKNDVRNLLQRIKSMVEQKSALNLNKAYEDYTNPGPIENIIYVPTHDGTGALTIGEIGGNVETDNLTDLDYFKNKMFAALGIPGAYLGEGDSDGSLFNNGNSLSLKSSKYAKTIKRIQNCFCQAITDAINLILLDKKLDGYVNAFTIRMQAPTTQEEKDRRDNLASTIDNIGRIMDLLSDIEDVPTKLEVLKSLLTGAVNDPAVLAALQNEIDRLEEEKNAELTGDTGDDLGGDFGGGEPMGDFGGGDLGGGGEDFGGDIDLGGEDMGGELPTPEEVGSTPMEPPAESFETGEGSLLNEEDNLPSFADLGINYTDVRR